MGFLFGRKKKAIDIENADFLCDYHCGGGMDGGRDWVSLSREKGGVPMLEYCISRGWNEEPIEGKKEVPEEAVRRVLEAYQRCGIAGLGKLRRTDVIALDAPTEGVSFFIGDEIRGIDC